MVHDHGRAEDITQEVFISALRRLRATDSPIIFKPWLYEIAKNACIDAFRRSKRAEEVSYDADDNGLDRSRLISKSPTPDVAVDQRLTLQNLQGAFGGLSEAHHQILVMRELEGLSYRQIGERLGMSRPSVESTLFRARRRLTEEYDELVSGERCRRVQGIIAVSEEGRLGIRDARKMARHVSHCQPCRRAACLAGVDLERLAPRPVRARLAALLPLPAFLQRRFGAPGDHSAVATPGATLAQWTGAAAGYSEPLASGWARAAAVAAGVAVAGVGAGVAGHESRLGIVAHHASAPVVRATPVAGATPAQEPRAHVVAPRSARPSTSGASRRHAPRSSSTSSHGTPSSAQHAPSAPVAKAPASAPAAGALDARRATGSVSVGASETPSATSLTASVPTVETRRVHVPVSVPALGAPSTAVTVAAPAAVDAAAPAVTEVTGAQGGTVGGVTSVAGNLPGGG